MTYISKEDAIKFDEMVAGFEDTAVYSYALDSGDGSGLFHKVADVELKPASFTLARWDIDFGTRVVYTDPTFKQRIGIKIEMWRDRIKGALAVLTGKAWVDYE